MNAKRGKRKGIFPGASGYLSRNWQTSKFYLDLSLSLPQWQYHRFQHHFFLSFSYQSCRVYYRYQLLNASLRTIRKKKRQLPEKERERKNQQVNFSVESRADCAETSNKFYSLGAFFAIATVRTCNHGLHGVIACFF